LLGKPFTIHTDHGVLTWLQTFKQPEGQMARWLQKLQEYNFTIVYRPGRQHINGDALSRLSCRQCGRNSDAVDQVISTVQMIDLSLSICGPTELRASQQADPVIGPIIQCKETEQKPQTTPADNLMYRRLAQLWD